MQKTFYEKWGTFIIGLISSLIIAINQLLSKGEDHSNTQVFIIAGAIAVLSYLSKEWRGQGMTILGIIGTAAGTIVTQLQTGVEISWLQVIMSVLTAIVFAVMPNPKPASYETNEQIVEAKKIPPVEQVPDNTPAMPPPNQPIN